MKIACARLSQRVHFVQRRKIQIKSARFQVHVTSKLRGLLFSNSVCEVVYISCTTYVTESGKTGLIHTSTEIQFLSISERYTHALPRNTKYLAIDG